MTTVAVIAHQNKTFDGGLPQLRALLAERGVTDPMWFEVPKSKKAPAAARKAVKQGADLLLLWGGDGTQQRCIDALRDVSVSIGILPAGTANLLATNLSIPIDLVAAVDIALGSARQVIDVGTINGERFAVMAGAGFDAIMMDDADGALKDRFGRLSYVWTGARATRSKAPKMRVTVDGNKWFDGRASCLLLGNMGIIGGGLSAFPDARSDDGLLEVGVVTAESALQWARVLTRLASGHAEKSPLTQMTRGRKIDVEFNRPVLYELDGGARKATKRLKIRVQPAAVSICVPGGGA